MYTCYVGAIGAERRVAIYRRDLRDDSGAFVEFGPLLRIEVRLKGDHADAMLSLLTKHGAETARAAAAAHIRELTGLEVQACVEVPKLATVEDAEQLAELWQFIDQHGERLVSWHKMGVDVVQLAREFTRVRSRMTRWRAFKRLERWACVDWEHLVERFRRRLADMLARTLESAA